MKKPSATMGWSRTGNINPDYHTKVVQNVAGVDFQATDGHGNVIKVSVRDGGHRIELNNVTLALELDEVASR